MTKKNNIPAPVEEPALSEELKATMDIMDIMSEQTGLLADILLKLDEISKQKVALVARGNIHPNPGRSIEMGEIPNVPNGYEIFRAKNSNDYFIVTRYNEEGHKEISFPQKKYLDATGQINWEKIKWKMADR